MEDQCYYYDSPWKLKLRIIGREVRKIWKNYKPLRFRKRKSGYTRFYTEDEERIRLLASQQSGVYGGRIARVSLLDYVGDWLKKSTIFPPGLHSLMHIDRVYVERAVDSDKGVGKYDRTKRYVVTSSEGEPIYTGVEESDPFARYCLDSSYSWTFHLFDNNYREILTFQRALRCSSCCFPCCLQKLTVHADGAMIGSVVQCWNPCRPSYAVRNAANENVLKIKGPCNLRCGGGTQFRIKSSDGKYKVGAIAKKCTGIACEFIEGGNSILVGFPEDLDVKIKAVLIGASFLFDHKYFEQPKERTDSDN